MPRPLRISYPGAYHHIVNRCNNKERFFDDARDFEKFLQLIKECKKTFGFKLYHYALLNNHHHLCVQESDKGSISKIMYNIYSEYTRWYNKTYSRSGHFWHGRFRNFAIDDDAYLLRCGIYIELNAVRAGLVTEPEQWPYSSIRSYTQGEENELVDLSPAYLELSKESEKRCIIYKEMIDIEQKRTNTIREYIRLQDKEKLKCLLRKFPHEPIPFKPQVTKLIGKNWKLSTGKRKKCQAPNHLGRCSLSREGISSGVGLSDLRQAL